MLDPWLQSAFEKLTSYYWRKRMGHAFLLTGSLEKAALLDALVSFFLCGQPSREGACGQCRSCQLALRNTHPDYHFFGREEAISIDDVRAIHDELQQTSHQGGTRVVVLEGVEQLSIYAANALLKNLEEPPSGTLFLLTAEKFAQVLSTIRSRCLHVHLVMPGGEMAIQYAKKGLEHDDLTSLKEALFWGNSQVFYQEEITKKLNTHTKETLYLFYYWVAEYCRLGFAADTGHLWTVSERARLDKLRCDLKVEKALTFLDVLINAIESLTVTGINKGLLWGSLAHQWAQLRTKD